MAQRLRPHQLGEVREAPGPARRGREGHPGGLSLRGLGDAQVAGVGQEADHGLAGDERVGEHRGHGAHVPGDERRQRHERPLLQRDGDAGRPPGGGDWRGRGGRALSGHGPGGLRAAASGAAVPGHRRAPEARQCDGHGQPGQPGHRPDARVPAVLRQPPLGGDRHPGARRRLVPEGAGRGGEPAAPPQGPDAAGGQRLRGAHQ